MVEHTEKVTRVERPTQNVGDGTTNVTEVTEATVAPSVLLARIIWFIAGILLVLLGFRFVFALLGANPSNGFANFIYTTSHPFVAPFFNLFGYNIQYGVHRFETFTLVAMAIYALIAFGLARLVTIGRPSPTAAGRTHSVTH